MLPSPEKKIESRITAPKSAIVPAAMISWPKVEVDLTGVLEHRDQDPERGRAEDDRHQQRRLDQPADLEQQRHHQRQGEGERRSRAGSAAAPARAAGRSRSPARPGRAGTPGPAREITEIVSSTSTIPSTEGPITIPARISSTTDGSRTFGKKPRTKGAAKATATTISRPVNDGMRGSARSRGSVTSSGHAARRSGPSEAAPSPKPGRSARRRGRRAARHRSGCHPRSAPSTGADRAPVPTTHTAAAGGGRSPSSPAAGPGRARRR